MNGTPTPAQVVELAAIASLCERIGNPKLIQFVSAKLVNEYAQVEELPLTDGVVVTALLEWADSLKERIHATSN